MMAKPSRLSRLINAKEHLADSLGRAHTKNGRTEPAWFKGAIIKRIAILEAAAVRIQASIDRESAKVAKGLQDSGAVVSALPWEYGGWTHGEDYEYSACVTIGDCNGRRVCQLDTASDESDEDTIATIALARHIILAVNMHDRLVEKLEDYLLLVCVHRKHNLCGKCARVECPELTLLKEARGENCDVSRKDAP